MHARSLTRRAAVAAAVLALGGPAPAAVIEVETVADGAVGSLCDLRDAITAANQDAPVGGCESGDPGLDVIDLTRLADLPDTIALAASLPPIGDDVTITGPGADLLTVSGGDAWEVLRIDAGAVVIEGITLADGLSGRGGCVAVSGLAGASLVLRDCRVTSCVGFNGGGIASDGADTRIERCLVDANATNGNSGGGIVHDGGRLEIVNSTISGNATTGADRPGGGIASFLPEGPPAGELVIHSSTLAGNAATGAGGNLFVATGVSATLGHTLLAEAVTGGNCAADVVSQGRNLSDDATCVLGGAGDQVEVPAGLDALADHGGPTPTRALLAGSAAIDAGAAGCTDPDGAALATDQRGPGFPRSTDGNLDGQVRCDVGAYELAPEPARALLGAAGVATLVGLARRRPRRVPSGG